MRLLGHQNVQSNPCLPRMQCTNMHHFNHWYIISMPHDIAYSLNAMHHGVDKNFLDVHCGPSYSHIVVLLSLWLWVNLPDIARYWGYWINYVGILTCDICLLYLDLFYIRQQLHDVCIKHCLMMPCTRSQLFEPWFTIMWITCLLSAFPYLYCISTTHVLQHFFLSKRSPHWSPSHILLVFHSFMYSKQNIEFR